MSLAWCNTEHRSRLTSQTLVLAQDLIGDCWSGEAAERPAARDVVSRLTAMEADIQALEAKCPRGVVKAAHANTGGAGANTGSGDKGASCCVIS
jgi:hypothetical protein